MDLVALIKRSRFVLPLACAAAVTMVVISEGAYWQSIRTLDNLGSISAARSSVQGLQQGILAAEAGQRGYLLTARKEHLKPYEAALEEIAESFRQLEPYYGADTDSGAVLDQLRALTDATLARTRPARTSC